MMDPRGGVEEALQVEQDDNGGGENGIMQGMQSETQSCDCWGLEQYFLHVLISSFRGFLSGGGGPSSRRTRGGVGLLQFVDTKWFQG